MKIVLIVLVIAAANVLLTVMLLWMIMRLAWGPMARRWPARTPAPGSVRHNFQSYRLGLLNLGYCVHTAVDEAYLHLIPAKAIRWLGGQPMSVPWSAIELKKRGRNARHIAARIDGITLQGPAWALELADPDLEADAAPYTRASLKSW
jgi:hypothetical protein